jgi:hypothetical protein
MHLRPAVVLLAGALLVSAAPPAADAQRQDFLETRDLRLLYFGVTQSYLAPYAARCFENAMGFHRQLFSWKPSERVTTLLWDFSDAGNASTNTVPRNLITVEIAPLSFAFETIVANERMNWLMNHELAHAAAMDQAGPADRFFRGLFRGKVAPVSDQPESVLYFYLTSPRVLAPRWYHEGLAVFVETWMAGGQGRAQGAYDEMMFRSMVRDGTRFYGPLGLVSEGTKEHFQTETNSYLYGTRFMDYLAYRYSPESVIQWGTRGKNTSAYYASQFERVFGLPLEKAWQDWIAFEHDFQNANLEAIRRYPVTPFTDLSPSGLGSVSRAFFDPDAGKIYAALNYPGVVGHIGAISVADGSVETLHEVKDPTKYTVSSLAYDGESKTIFYTTDNFAYRDLVAFDVRTRRARTLQKDARIGELAFDRADRSLWGIRVFNGICTLVRIPPPYTEWKQMVSWPYGTVVYDLDVSPDGRLLFASVGEIDGSQSVHVMKVASLLEGDPTPTRTFDFGTAIPLDFVFSPDGRYLYGSSYYTGVSNIFRYDLGAQKVEAVSNTETGFFRPIPRADGTLIVFRYTGQGFVPATIDVHPVEDVAPITFLGEQVAEKHPVVKTWKVGSPAGVPLDSLITARGKYSSIRHVGLESIYPVVQGYKDSVGVGLRANFSDPTLFNRMYVTASYSPDDTLAAKERTHVSAGFERYDWNGFLEWNRADFYDLFGPTETSLKGYGAGLGWHRTLVFDLPRRLDVNVDVSYYGGLERLPDFQGIPSNFTSTFATRVRLRYENMRHSLGYVDEEKGTAWELLFGGDRAGGRSFPKLLGSFDQGFALPLKHSSIWLRGAAGFSPSDPDQPFANFFFGGFRNNWVDHRDEKRYRDWYSFPGLEINEVGGRNFAKGMLEWNLPPVRFRRVGKPGFFLTWARPAVFVSVLGTDLDNEGRRQTLADAGAQVDLRFTILSRLDMTLSAGYGVAVEDGFKPRREGMISLKVLQ